MEEIIKELALLVGRLPFVSRSGALAQISNATAGANNGTFVMARIAPFDKAGMQYIGPDKKEMGIAFWQSGPTKVSRQDVWLRGQENELTLTVWVNGERVKEAQASDYIGSVVQAIRNYRIPIADGSPIRMAEIEFQGDSYGEIVTAYGWDGLNFKYHEQPHSLFQVKFKLTTMVSSGCSDATYAVINPYC